MYISTKKITIKSNVSVNNYNQRSIEYSIDNTCEGRLFTESGRDVHEVAERSENLRDTSRQLIVRPDRDPLISVINLVNLAH